MTKIEQIAWTEVESGNVKQVAYHPESETLMVRFHNGGLYSYDSADETTFVGLLSAASVGRYLNNVVKVLHTYVKWNSEPELIAYLNER